MQVPSLNPKVFLSYSWTDSDHEVFVLELATALRSHGIDVKLDKWDLLPGQDKFAFMESMVTDPTMSKVLIICDRRYMEKADARAGGVGTETQIVSQELYTRVDQTKFIPVVREYDGEGKACLPVYLKSRIYVDVSGDDQYGEGLDRLLRLIYDKPQFPRPALGAAPTYLQSPNGMPFVRDLAAAVRAIRDGRPNRHGLEQLFVKAYIAQMDALYVTPTGEAFDDQIYQAIQNTKMLRDQLSEYLDTIAAFCNDDAEQLAPFIRLLEGLGANFYRADESGRYREAWTDLYSFVALEATLLAGAALLRYERWRCLRKLFSHAFLTRSQGPQLKASSYLVFDTNQNALDVTRAQRLKLERRSVAIDLLKERCSREHTEFQELAQADVFFALESAVNLLQRRRATGDNFWRPRTTSIMRYSQDYPVFLRAADPQLRAGVRVAFGLESADEFAQRVQQVLGQEGGFRMFSADPWGRFKLDEITNLKVLAS